ncbi:hypothetical protein P3T18_001098 [Paraburkholderia sp. GAS199]|uniref:hypothetical protein n=1 Tax=Paraburkholderia sp. GAS199 TaxID=3035126 RepID=UPI003D25AF4B
MDNFVKLGADHTSYIRIFVAGKMNPRVVNTLMEDKDRPLPDINYDTDGKKGLGRKW